MFERELGFFPFCQIQNIPFTLSPGSTSVSKQGIHFGRVSDFLSQAYCSWEKIHNSRSLPKDASMDPTVNWTKRAGYYGCVGMTRGSNMWHVLARRAAWKHRLRGWQRGHAPSVLHAELEEGGWCPGCRSPFPSALTGSCVRHMIGSLHTPQQGFES